MTIRIRLARGGAKKRPYYRIVVADARSPRDGRFIERVGSYNPLLPNDNKERVVIKADRVQYWLSVGALPSDRVAKFLADLKLVAKPAISEQTKKNQPKKKAQEKLAADKAAAEAAKAAAEEAKAASEKPVEEGAAAGEELVETLAEQKAQDSAIEEVQAEKKEAEKKLEEAKSEAE